VLSNALTHPLPIVDRGISVAIRWAYMVGAFSVSLILKNGPPYPAPAPALVHSRASRAPNSVTHRVTFLTLDGRQLR
jgi:hypothetical protein